MEPDEGRVTEESSAKAESDCIIWSWERLGDGRTAGNRSDSRKASNNSSKEENRSMANSRNADSNNVDAFPPSDANAPS